MNKKFLIVQLGKYGDCLYATSIVKQIKSDFPTSHITWLICSNFKSILDENPFIDNVLEVDCKALDYFALNGWLKLQEEINSKKESGIYDEIIYSQIPPLNWPRFRRTIRETTISAYSEKYTVDLSPVLKLKESEVNRVKDFSEKYQLNKFKQVVLFECAPGSYQSQVNPDYAISIAKKVIDFNPEVCFILSSNTKLEFNHPQIFDGFELTYRENAELTKYCTIFIGCSSGITWISTSDWAKKLPTLQLLNPRFFIYSGMNYDFKISNLNNTHIIELLQYNQDLVVKILIESFNSDWSAMKSIYNQDYKPTIDNFNNVLFDLALRNANINTLLNYTFHTKRFIESKDGIFKINIISTYFKVFYYTLYSKLKKLKNKIRK